MRMSSVKKVEATLKDRVSKTSRKNEFYRSLNWILWVPRLHVVEWSLNVVKNFQEVLQLRALGWFCWGGFWWIDWLVQVAFCLFLFLFFNAGFQLTWMWICRPSWPWTLRDLPVSASDHHPAGQLLFNKPICLEQELCTRTACFGRVAGPDSFL